MTVVTRVYSVINDHCYPPGLLPGAQTEDSDEETMTHAAAPEQRVRVRVRSLPNTIQSELHMHWRLMAHHHEVILQNSLRDDGVTYSCNLRMSFYADFVLFYCFTVMRAGVDIMCI